jgi:nitrite reductase (NO-forming)
VKRSTWHLRTGAIVATWLVALLAVSILGLLRPVPGWLVVHLLLLGAVSNAILIWSTHFAAALLRLPDPGSRRGEVVRLGTFNAGAVMVVLGMVTHFWAAVPVGGALVAGAGGWHAVVLLGRMRRALPSRFAVTVRYYVAAGALLPIGVTFGVIMAPDHLSDSVHARLALAHVAVNLLGWMGLTVVGTVVTLWPTMLHTRVADGAERAARRALPMLVLSLAVVVIGALAASREVAVAGIVGYLAGLTVAGRPLVQETRSRRPTTYPTWSVLAGLVWLAGSVTALAVIVAASASWERAADTADRLAAPLLVGFAGQVLLGALSFLVPVVLGGGPSVTRATAAVLETAGTARVTITNVGLLANTLPLPPAGRAVSAAAVLAAMALFLPLVLRAVRLERSLTRGQVGLLPTDRHPLHPPSR